MASDMGDFARAKRSIKRIVALPRLTGMADPWPSEPDQCPASSAANHVSRRHLSLRGNGQRAILGFTNFCRRIPDDWIGADVHFNHGTYLRVLPRLCRRSLTFPVTESRDGVRASKVISSLRPAYATGHQAFKCPLGQPTAREGVLLFVDIDCYRISEPSDHGPRIAHLAISMRQSARNLKEALWQI